MREENSKAERNKSFSENLSQPESNQKAESGINDSGSKSTQPSQEFVEPGTEAESNLPVKRDAPASKEYHKPGTPKSNLTNRGYEKLDVTYEQLLAIKKVRPFTPSERGRFAGLTPKRKLDPQGQLKKARHRYMLASLNVALPVLVDIVKKGKNDETRLSAARQILEFGLGRASNQERTGPGGSAVRTSFNQINYSFSEPKNPFEHITEAPPEPLEGEADYEAANSVIEAEYSERPSPEEIDEALKQVENELGS